MEMRKIKVFLLVAGFCACSFVSYGQSSEFSRSSIKGGIGIGFNDGKRETGMGTLFFMGYQRSYWNERVRINPNLTTGGFTSIGITDTRQQFYRISSLGVNGYIDALKYRSVSIFLGTGVFVNYSRGLLGTGGELSGNERSVYFYEIYYGGLGTGGIRVNPKNHRFAYEFSPVSILLGTEGFTLGYMKLGVDFKLGCRKSN